MTARVRHFKSVLGREVSAWLALTADTGWRVVKREFAPNLREFVVLLEWFGAGEPVYPKKEARA